MSSNLPPSVWVVVDGKYGPLEVYSTKQDAEKATDDMDSPSGAPLGIYEFEVIEQKGNAEPELVACDECGRWLWR